MTGTEYRLAATEVAGLSRSWSAHVMGQHALAYARASDGRPLLLAVSDRGRLAAAVLAAGRAGVAIAMPPSLLPAAVTDFGATHQIWVDTDALSDAVSGATDLRDLSPTAGPGDDSADAGEAVEARWSATDPFVTVYTSGSQGAPQAWPKSARQLLGEARVLAELLELRQGETVLATVPGHHIYGFLLGVLVPMTAGATIVREAPLHAVPVEHVVRELHCDLLVSTPAHLRGLEVLDAGRLDRLRRVVSSGAPLHASTARMLMERFGVGALELLGSTETGGFGYRERTEEDSRWRPLPGITVDECGGQLQVRSPFVRDKSGVFLSADRGVVHPDGSFEHLGRADDIVKIGGRRLSRSALERATLGLEGVEDAAVFVDEAPDGRGARVRLAVVAPQRSASWIREQLASSFDGTLLPRRILRVPQLPRTATGKLPALELAKMFASHGQRGSGARELTVLNIATTTAGRRVHIHVPDDLVFFEGHFPDDPVLPGVVQLERMVWPLLRQQFDATVERITRLKFLRPIAPGDRIELVLESRGAHQVRFQVLRAAELCTSGTLHVRDSGDAS